ncbi:FecR family protein [Dongia sedimenti]|uniref:FecR family protein n=1 Tax=Dongia sedimenti TaxID=3064282 RepID=A0ABU0YMU0_9PROT|nr:FecR family protein [Rhodospirillaceae bacterium R-7]
MRSLHTAIATILFGATTIAVAYGAASTTPVGDVEVVKEDAYGTPPAAAREAKHRGDGVVYQETLETLQKSGLLVKFNDGSKLTLGANSRIMVDSFVYAPGDNNSKALISIPIGALRYVTGAMPKGQTTIDTPTATMVLRGTNVKVLTDGRNTLLVVDEGSVSVHNKQTGEDTVVEEGDSVQISSTGINSTDEDDTGDPAVDDGLAQNTGKSGNQGTPEQRRGSERSQPSRSNNSGNSTGGSSSSGGGTNPG